MNTKLVLQLPHRLESLARELKSNDDSDFGESKLIYPLKGPDEVLEYFCGDPNSIDVSSSNYSFSLYFAFSSFFYEGSGFFAVLTCLKNDNFIINYSKLLQNDPLLSKQFLSFALVTDSKTNTYHAKEIIIENEVHFRKNEWFPFIKDSNLLFKDLLERIKQLDWATSSIDIADFVFKFVQTSGINLRSDCFIREIKDSLIKTFNDSNRKISLSNLKELFLTNGDFSNFSETLVKQVVSNLGRKLSISTGVEHLLKYLWRDGFPEKAYPSLTVDDYKLFRTYLSKGIYKDLYLAVDTLVNNSCTDGKFIRNRVRHIDSICKDFVDIKVFLNESAFETMGQQNSFFKSHKVFAVFIEFENFYFVHFLEKLSDYNRTKGFSGYGGGYSFGSFFYKSNPVAKDIYSKKILTDDLLEAVYKYRDFSTDYYIQWQVLFQNLVSAMENNDVEVVETLGDDLECSWERSVDKRYGVSGDNALTFHQKL
ncbi:MAG: hypothetical protein KAG61_10280, partial [Bacteriovoracaceae bacterium]|nr:hypothetical protein [Bacteriovoracaceae bacterium]